jgi:hypothetical protein
MANPLLVWTWIQIYKIVELLVKSKQNMHT